MDENGRLDIDDLRQVEDSKYMDPQAGTAYALMVQAAKEAGVGWGVTDAYRTYDQQVSAAQRKGLYNQGGWAAVPGTSQHGWGKALDLNNQKGSGLNASSTQFKWLKDNAAKYGFETIPREPWHWQFDQNVWDKYNKSAPWLGVTSTQASAGQKAASLEGFGRQDFKVMGPASDYSMSGFKGNNSYSGSGSSTDTKPKEHDDSRIPSVPETASQQFTGTNYSGVGADLTARIV